MAASKQITNHTAIPTTDEVSLIPVMEISSPQENNLVGERIIIDSDENMSISTGRKHKEACTTAGRKIHVAVEEQRDASPLRDLKTIQIDNYGCLIVNLCLSQNISRVSDASNPDVTPDSIKNRLKRNRYNGAKAARALQFEVSLDSGETGVAYKRRRRLKSGYMISNGKKQLKIPFPCRKCSICKKALLIRASTSQISSEKTVNLNITSNPGTIIVGNNLKIGDNEGGLILTNAPEKPLHVNMDENYKVFLEKFYYLTNSLHPLRDNGKFAEFYVVAADMEFHYSTEPHLKIIIMIETSVALCYQKEFDKSEELINKAVQMTSNLGVKMKNFLLVYCHCHLTGLNRRKNLSWEASSSVHFAHQTEESIPFSIMKVFVAYEEASNLTKQLSLISIQETEARLPLMANAKKKLKECISLADRVLGEYSCVYLQRQSFSLAKLALMNLNCRTKTSRQFPVDEESILEAERCIKKMEEYEGDTSAALSIQFYVAKCDLCFRKKDFYGAKRFGLQALEIATDNSFNLEIKPIQERLNDITEQI